MQRDFARCYVLNGGKGELAAIEAGYSPGGAAQISTRNLRHKLVMGEIKRLSIVNMEAALPNAIRKLLDIIDNDAAPADVRLRAITTLLDRAGVPKASTGPSVAVQVNVGNQSGQSLVAEIWSNRAARERALALPNGADQGQLSDIEDGMTDNSIALSALVVEPEPDDR